MQKEDDKRIPTYERRNYANTGSRLGTYGYVVVKPLDDEHDALVRKITPFQRRCILLYKIQLADGKGMIMRMTAFFLGCKERTLQYDLRWLEKKGYITIESTVDKNGATSFNRYHFVRAIESEFYDFKPTITKVYAQGNPLALREWHWDDYKTIPGVNDDYHNAFDKYENYVELSAKKRKKRKIEDERLTEVRSPILNKHK